MRARATTKTMPNFDWLFAVMMMALLALVGGLVHAARADDQGQGIETGSIKRDAHVAPVRRVFPKTPSDRELRRLSKTATAKPKSKTNKR